MSDRSFLIKNALVHDGLGGILPEHDVYVEGGKIGAVGRGLTVPACPTVDARGMELFPGFVAALSPWGGVGPSLSDQNLSEHGSLVTPHMDVTYAFQPDSITYQRLYRWGITAACLTPSFDNLFGGFAAVYKTHGRSYGDFLLRPQVFAAASLSGRVRAAHLNQRYAETDMGLLHLFRQTLRDAETGVSGHTPEGRAMAQILDGSVPLVLCCDSRARWVRAREILEDYPRLRCVLTGLYGITAEDLIHKDGHLPAILWSIADASHSAQDRMDYAALDAAVGAGAPVAASPYLEEAAMTHAEAVLWNGAALRQNGLDPEQVVRMLCSLPASILGVDDRIGSIRPGLDADLALWSSSPVTSFAAQLRHVWVDGVEINTQEEARFCW